jgi:DNA topoisomerase-1
MLRFTDLSAPGITRKRIGRAWGYFDPKGKRITNRDEIDRLNAIGLPPAYEEAWFCPHPDCHIQAIGVDARGRRQYRYHPDFRAKKDAGKYADCAEFGKALPKIRRQVDRTCAARTSTRNVSSRPSSACSTRRRSASVTGNMRATTRAMARQR